ncbi:vWA domain-containing protein [Pelagimonas varians]|uniref:von Willebrand factor n=1 Tax=Pelagimonas varians TaxID=696760 RepID=A0A238KJU6_9RHOB|nr:VWA domain-containing protein [Pelagimonas varians]PYG29482.1 Ca-activated chloride channel family protein [Pelagimonas varians]SMX42974.1 von Willebrand factor [Pelagimonas varians]
MSEFDDLKRALDAAAPAPDAARKQDNFALAMENFDDLQFSRQGNANGARPTSEHPKTGLLRGVRNMIAHFSTKGLLTASTALAAFGLVVFLPVLRDNMPNGSDLLATEQAEPVENAVSAEISDAPLIEADEVTDSLVRPKPTLLPAPAAAAKSGVPSAARSQGLTSLSADGIARTLPAPMPEFRPAPDADTEAFSEAEANPLKVTAEEPVSTFSIDVDTASWSILRNSLTYGNLPPEGAVRIEEMVNYFTYDYPTPEGDQPFKSSVGVTDTPWNDGTQIVHIGLQGAMPAQRPAMNLVFLIDTSGSMDQPNKLPLLKQSFRLMLGQLSEEDSVSIVTYAGSAGRVLDPTPASDRDTILAALDNLKAGGGTAGQAGLQQAYATAKEMAEEGDVSRVILATDGDFNIGIHDPEELEAYIAKERDSGTYLSVLGFGRGNLDDATMQALAQTGNGMAAYIDTLAEAQKVLVDQLTGALVPIADDVKIQVEFNPGLVAEYRLIGYETRALKRVDFNNDKVDAGEIGAGHQVTAVYEITPVGSDARLTDPLRYGTDPEVIDSNELGFLRLRYKTPGEDESQLIETPILADTAPLPDADFALAIAGFGQILRGSDLIGDWSFDDAITLAQGAKGADPYGYRQEAVTLMRLAQSLSQ